MSGTTVELNLATAVDSDDNADYLTLSLANSLRTVDGLFNSVTGHTHGGAHQGGPVAIPDGSIQAGDIADGAITSAKILDGAILGGDIAAGTITTTNIMDGTILKDDIAPGAVSRAFVTNGTTNGPSTTSAVPVDMPDMATTFAAPFTTSIYYWFSCSFSMSGAGAIGVFVLDLDGTNIMINYIQQVGVNLSLTAHGATAVLAAGTHTLKVRWWLIAAGTLTATATYRSLTLLEMHV